MDAWGLLPFVDSPLPVCLCNLLEKKERKKTEAPSSDSSESSDISDSKLTFNADDDTELDGSDNKDTAASAKKKRLQSPIRLEERELCRYEQVRANNISEQRKMLAEFEEEDRVRRQLEAGTKQRELILELDDDFDLD